MRLSTLAIVQSVQQYCITEDNEADMPVTQRWYHAGVW